MSTVGDDKYAALKAAGYSGTLPDAEAKFWAVAAEEGIGGTGVTWVTEGAETVGFLGPDGTTVYAVFVRQPDGSVQMQITPRTGTLAALRAVAGSNGELSSATDAAAIIKHSGTSGQAQVYWAQESGNAGVIATGTGANRTHPPIDPSYPLTIVTKEGPVTSISNFGQLSNGITIGQQTYILNSTGLPCTLRPDGATSQGLVSNNTLIEFKWTGTKWLRTNLWVITNSGNAVGGGTATDPTATTVGGGTASGAGAVAVGGGTASGVNSLSFRGATASGHAAIAIKGVAAGNGAVALGGAPAFLANSIGLITNPTNGATQKAQELEFILARTIAADSFDEVLTLDGISPSSGNTLRASSFSGNAVIEVKVRFIDPWSSPARARFWEYLVAVNSTGTALTILGTYLVSVTPTAFGDFTGSGGEPSISFAVGATFQDLHVRVTSGSDYDGDAMATCRLSGFWS